VLLQSAEKLNSGPISLLAQQKKRTMGIEEKNQAKKNNIFNIKVIPQSLICKIKEKIWSN
jgi:hypothetical protein